MKSNRSNLYLSCIVCKKHFIPDKTLSVDFCSRNCEFKWDEKLKKHLEENSLNFDDDILYENGEEKK